MCEIFKQVLEERETKRKYILGKNVEKYIWSIDIKQLEQLDS